VLRARERGTVAELHDPVEGTRLVLKHGDRVAGELVVVDDAARNVGPEATSTWLEATMPGIMRCDLQ